MSVYEGVWYDHAVNKLILTLSPNAAGFLTAAIVTWVNLVAASTWPIWRCLLYLVRQNASTNDVFHHQRQIMLRNSSSAAGAAGQLIAMAWKWRSFRARAFWRTAAYLIICVAIFLVWTLCGLYAPYIYTRTTSDVLLAQSPHCGWAVGPTTPDNGQLEVFNKFTAETVDSNAAANIYVQQCYGTSNSTGDCNDYPRRSLEFQTGDGKCPFGSTGQVCISVNSTVMTLDTGYLDSNRDFGFNAAPSDAVQYRRLSTCSPIHSRGFVNEINTTGTPLAANFAPEEVLFQYLYGPYDGFDYTYQYELWQSAYPIAYTLDARHYIAGFSEDRSDSYLPNVTFFDANQNMGDLSVLFLAGNNVKYVEPLYDPWFAAGLNPLDVVVVPNDNTTNFTVYASSYWAVPLACHEQHQICIAGSDSNCTPLTGADLLINETSKLQGLKFSHAATAGVISYASGTTGMADVVGSLGDSVLLATRTLNGDLQTAEFSQDHWRLEMENLFSVGLARMQSLALSYSKGPRNPALNSFVNPANEVFQKYVCQKQRVRDPQGNVNFDMPGLIILVVVGVFLMVLGLSFENLLGWLARSSSRLSASRAKWLAEGLYHLHKTTLEARGVRDWQKTTSTIPRSTQLVDEVFEFQQNGNEQTISFLHTGKA